MKYEEVVNQIRQEDAKEQLKSLLVDAITISFDTGRDKIGTDLQEIVQQLYREDGIELKS